MSDGILHHVIRWNVGFPGETARYLHTMREGQCCRHHVHGNSVHQ